MLIKPAVYECKSKLAGFLAQFLFEQMREKMLAEFFLCKLSYWGACAYRRLFYKTLLLHRFDKNVFHSEKYNTDKIIVERGCRTITDV